MPMHPRPDASRAGLLFGGLALALLLSGCPQGADLENPEAWAGRFGTAGTGTGSGGTSGTGPVLDWNTVTCDPSFDRSGTTQPASADFMANTCAKSFCHGPNFVAGLDMRTDEGFASRVKDVPAKFNSIPCADDITMNCIPASCPPAGMALIVDSQDPAMSWMIAKSNHSPLVGGLEGCGDNMPPSSGLTTDSEKECLMNIVNAVAALK